MKNSPTLLILLSIVLLLGAIGLLCWQELDCQKKKCPDGLKPYKAAHSSKCLCVKEAE